MRLKSILSLVLACTLTSAGLCRNVVSNELIAALIQVESDGNDTACGDNDKAIGCLQIWPITVKDANRILGQEKYQLKDRLNRQKSIEMCRIILGHYESGNEAQARRWNGGGNWRKNKQTIKYWQKVKKILDNHKK